MAQEQDVLKSDLIKETAKKAMISETVADTVVNAFLQSLMKHIKKNKTVVINELGKFYTVYHPARVGYSPNKDDERNPIQLVIPPKMSVRFISAKTLDGKVELKNKYKKQVDFEIDDPEEPAPDMFVPVEISKNDEENNYTPEDESEENLTD